MQQDLSARRRKRLRRPHEERSQPGQRHFRRPRRKSARLRQMRTRPSNFLKGPSLLIRCQELEELERREDQRPLHQGMVPYVQPHSRRSRRFE